MLPLLLVCMQNVIYAEEVSHCAAGVRWLKHLHALAHRLGQQAGAGAAAGEAAAQTHGKAQQQPASTEPRQQENGNMAGGQQEQRLPAWAEEAARHATVEQWFHALVRAHFRGPLKPPL